MSPLAALLAPYVAAVEAEMRRQVPPLDAHRPFWTQIHYHLGWASAAGEPEEAPRGKRVRAALCLMVCEALAGDTARALPAAAAIELLHAFSLVHDDIEDRDPMRHHRPTLWTVVGEAQAINAGDGLFALAQAALLRSAERGVPAETVLRAQRRLNETAIRLCIGQHLDMSFEGRASVSPDEYLEMVGGKTASLLAFAGEAGALAAGADEASVEAIRAAGEALGLAFQMRDDALGLWGDPARTGKPVGADLRARKKSLPIAYALAQPGSERLRALYAGPLEDDADVAEALRLVEATGAREWVNRLAREQEARAIEALQRLAAPPERVAKLVRLAELLMERDY